MSPCTTRVSQPYNLTEEYTNAFPSLPLTLRCERHGAGATNNRSDTEAANAKLRRNVDAEL